MIDDKGMEPTFADLDLDAGVSFGDIFHASHNTRHGGQKCATAPS